MNLRNSFLNLYVDTFVNIAFYCIYNVYELCTQLRLTTVF